MGQLGPIRGRASLPFLLEEKKGRKGAPWAMRPTHLAGQLPPLWGLVPHGGGRGVGTPPPIIKGEEGCTFLHTISG